MSARQRPHVALSSVEVSPRPPVAGSPFFVVVTLYNGGLAEACNLNVAATSAEGFVPVTSTRQAVSRLAPQVASVVSFGFNATGPLAGNVAVRVEYVDAYGRRHSDEAVIPVAVCARHLSDETTLHGGPVLRFSPLWLSCCSWWRLGEAEREG